jgi:hypothetical protein
MIVVGLLTAAVVLPAAGKADTQPVAGTTSSVLGLSLSGAVALLNFAPGQTATGTGAVTVTSTGPWVLRLHDADATNPGHLLRTVGTSGASALAQTLQWSSAPTLGGTGASGSLTGSPALAASGSLSDLVNVTYTQPIGSTERLATGSVYGLTVTWTISAT